MPYSFVLISLLGITLNFSDLPVDHRITKNITKLNLQQLTEIQEKAIRHAILNKDILAASKTGSGKTLAFVIPMIHRLLSQKALTKADPRALILAPTRELAKQVFLVVKQIAATTPLKANLVVGGENYNDQAKLLKKKPHIIVATAGRIHDHLNDRHLFLNGLELLILDEADRMLELGFSAQLANINAQANHRKRQTMMFSATIEQAQIKDMTAKLLKNPQVIKVNASNEPHVDIQQAFYLSDNVKQKDEQLLKLISIQDRQQCIVFTATRNDTQRLADHLNEHNILSTSLHGELLQNQRNQIIQSFSNNKFAVLVTTDLAARGLDIKNVALVINYDLPKFPEEYIHRIGRTGRAGSKGRAISLIGKKDWQSFESIRDNYIGKVEFSKLDGVDTKFSGFVKKHKFKQTKVAKVNTKKSPKSSSVKTKRINTMISKEVGFTPIKRKKSPSSHDSNDE